MIKRFNFVIICLCVLSLCLFAACNGVTPSDSNEAPAITELTDQSGMLGDKVELQIVATDPEADALSFSASGLPTGLSVSSAGSISGVLSEAARFETTVAVDDGQGNKPSISFSWLVNPADTQGPVLSKTEALSNTKVEVSFSEAIKGGDNPANFSIFPELSITGASVSIDAKTVTLTTAPQETIAYALLVKSGLTDLAGNPFDLADNEPFSTSFTGKAALPLEPPEFKVSIAGYSAEEPKLMVAISDLKIEGLETLAYRLERFSDQCNDSSDVKTGTIDVSSSSVSFDILTTNYGAFKLSVSATYQEGLYQSSSKTVLPDAPDLDDLPASKDFKGLVYVEILDDHVQNRAKQINLEGSDLMDDAPSPEFSIGLDLTAFSEPIFVNYELSGFGANDRKWCDLDGNDFVARNAADLIVDRRVGGSIVVIDEPLAVGETSLELFLGSNTANAAGDRIPFLLLDIAVFKREGSVSTDLLYKQQHIVIDCDARQSAFSDLSFPSADDNVCFQFNDFPR